MIPQRETYPALGMAQELNNRAAQYMETGKYNLAMEVLVVAIKLNEPSNSVNPTQNATCPCQYCSLDYCMRYSQETIRYDRPSADQDHHAEASGGYLYRLPIRISPQSLSSGHCMGMVLSLILTFNLALAHHLSLVNGGCANEEKSTLSRSRLQHVLKLYELAHRLQLVEANPQFHSAQFTMVLLNNLGEIHRLVSNRDKHQKCIEHLLGTLMVLVDCHHQSSHVHSSFGAYQDMILDGFFRNICELILRDKCARAA
jgi:hypothetical protein